MAFSWIKYSTQATNAQYVITYEGGTDNKVINQRGTNCQWSGFVDQGSYQFNAGTTYSVVLSNVGANGNVFADAMQVRSMEAPMDVYVDDDWGPSALGDDLGGGKIYGYNAFATIQEAIDQVQNTGTIHVMNGRYEQQLIVESKNITIMGESESGVVLRSPTSLVTRFTTSGPNKPVLYVHASEVNVSNMTIDGFERANGNYRMNGVAYYNSSGTLTNITVTNIKESPASGTQQGVGVYLYNDDSVSRIVDMDHMTINNYQKNGSVFAGVGLTANISNCDITGLGEIDFIAQNGIQYSSGATGTVDSCTIKDNYYTPATWSSTGILLYAAGSGVTVKNSTIDHNGWGGIYSYLTGSNLHIFGNTLKNNMGESLIVWGPDHTGLSIHDNMIFDNDTGMYLSSDVPSPVSIYNNTFSNPVNVLDDGNHFVDNGSNRGNTWNNYNGVDTNGDGIGETAYVIDADSQDRYPVTTNTLTTPTITSPSNNAVLKSSNLLKIDWSDATGTFPAFQYRYQAFSNASYTSSVYLSGWLSASEIPTPGTPQGVYYVRVKAKDMHGNETGWSNGPSNPFKITVDNTPPTVPTILTPSENAYFNSSPILNDWTDATDASGIDHYRIEYVYDDGHTFSGGPYRESTVSQRNHSPSITEQGGVKFRVQAFDKAGNEGGWSAWRHYYYDATKPTVDLTFQTPGPSATSFNAVFNESVKEAEAENPANYFLHNWPGAGGTGNLSGHATIVYDDATHTATVTFTTPGWYLSAEQEWGVENVYDLAGNIQSVNPYKETTTAMVSPEAPGVPVTSPNPTKSSSQVWTYTAAVDPGGVNASGIKGYWYKITGDTTTAFTYVGNTTSITTNLPEGSYTLHVKAEDNAGNVGPESTGNVLIDTTSPINPTVSSTTHTVDVWSQTPVLTMSWSGASDALTGVAGYSYVLDSSALTIPDTTSEGNGTSATSGTLSDGQYYFHLRTVDGAGNWSDPVHVGPFKLDGTTPESTITSPVNSGTNTTVITNSWDGAIEGTATDATSGVDYVALSIQRASDGFFYNGEGWSAGTEETVRVTATGTTSWSFTLPEPSEDSYTIKSHAVDLAGNIENTYTLTIVLDKTIPEVSITLNPVNPDGSNNWYKTNPTVTLTANDNYDLSRIEYQWDSTTGSWTTYVNPFQVPSEGQHVLYYRSLDTAGNFSETGIKNIKYDATNLTEGPMHVSVSPDPTSGSTATVKWDEATDNTGINKYEVTWSLNGVSYTHTVGGDVRKDDIDKLTEGVWKITVKAFDGVGNSKEASVNLTVDRTAPQPPVLTLTGTGVGTASLSWNSVSGATDYIVWYGTTPGARTYGARVGNVTSYTVGGLAGGTYYFVVRSVDSVNNQSGDSNEVSTGSITGAPGALPNQPVQGFAPEVLGAATESGELTQPDGTNEDTAQGSVLGETTISNLPWWIIPLLALFFFMIFFYLKKRKNQE